MDTLVAMIRSSRTRTILLCMISEQNPTFEALIEMAFRTALLDSNVDMVEFLIKNSLISPNDPIRIFNSACPPLEIAIHEQCFKIAEFVINAGADLRKQCSWYYKGTLLHYLAENVPPEILQLILDKGSVNVFEAIQVFQQHGHGEIARNALEKSVNLKQILLASERSTLEAIKLLSCVLRTAVTTSSFRIVEMMIKSCRDLEVGFMDKIDDGLIFLAVDTGSFDMVRLLLRNGADANIRGPCSISALTLAILDGKLKIAKHLIEWGASTERHLSDRNTAPTPLQAAVFKGFHEIASILITRGAKVAAPPSTILSLNLEGKLKRIYSPIRDIWARSALHIAASVAEMNRLKMVRLLVLEGADVDRFLYGVVERTADQSEAMPNLSDVVFRYLLSASPSFPVEDALYVAIQLGFMRSLQFIAKREADGNLQAPSIQPPVRSGTRGFDPKMQLSMVSYLVQRGLPSNIRTADP